MKKIISLILCVLMIVPLFSFAAFSAGAGDGKDEKAFNFALRGSAYATSKWNNDSDPKYINNGDQSDSYRYWRPNGHGRDIYIDDKEQLCGLKFQDGKYYKVQEVVIYNYMEEESNNIKYTIEALVLGEWKVIGEAHNLDPENVFTGMIEGDNGRVGALTIDVEDTVTKHIRLKVSEWGRWSTYYMDENGNIDNDYDNPDTEDYDPRPIWNHWWKVPVIHELETWGIEAPADEIPAWDVPEGAILSTNACLSGFAHATSTNSLSNIYPALVNDDVKTPDLITTRPYWQSNVRQNGTEHQIWCNFDQPYDITNVSLNFGGSVDGTTLTYNVDILVGNQWVSIATNKTATSSVAAQEDIVYNFADLGGTQSIYRASAVKVTFTSALNASGRDTQALLTEMGAEISATNKDANGNLYPKCIFLKDYITADKKQAASSANLAVFGTAYASSVMTYANISSIDYINDGGRHYDLNYSWFAETFEKGSYCGVVLQQSFMVDKVVLYFNDPVTGSVSGDCVMEFDIKVKVGSTYQTVKSGITSYDAKKKEYVVSIAFDAPINTNDVRIEYTANGLVFPYIKEFEIYSSTVTDADNGASYESYDSYTGYPIGQRDLCGKLVNSAEDLAKKSTVVRSKYLDKISPIEYFDITSRNGIDVQSWQ